MATRQEDDATRMSPGWFFGGIFSGLLLGLIGMGIICLISACLRGDVRATALGALIGTVIIVLIMLAAFA